MRVLIHVAGSVSNLPSSEPRESVKRTTTSIFFLESCFGLPPRPNFCWGTCCLPLSILTTSSGFSSPTPLLVAQPATPSAPMYLLSGVEAKAGGRGDAEAGFVVASVAGDGLSVLLG